MNKKNIDVVIELCVIKCVCGGRERDVRVVLSYEER